MLSTLIGHTQPVFNANFSPDGKEIVTASLDNTAKVWDIQGKLLSTLIGHTQPIINANFSPDGKEIVTASYDKTAKFLVKVGEDKAKAGNVDEAVVNFKTALKWNGELKFNLQEKVQEFEIKGKAERKVSEGESLVGQKKIKEAIAAYNQAQKLDPQVEIGANTWDSLCKQGSLNKSAKEVMFACEKAVKLASNNGKFRDSRGLARALTGNYQGAISDFEAFIAQTTDKDLKTQRQGWVQALRGGKNPFTKEELKKLDQ
ncbi:MAG: hypothetical protein PUP92_25650 [Rhizonema sp. PD38]|nr:hypothetical protein [Rhizonema sp. PD38]